ncbi:LOW QUALITY PROTEIN: hypothetical protein PHMEG_00029756 [Phytophthora megakarya]|uniref:Jacalin-type lectin domain-containing protein n=1 Tax=Phytophthora megakarya TaxID=4795 RepID=A0A225V1N4_9STRA|nr:LOW QUALITY PROTEIN: hypothetical protein PHMEG_00029756 [Phytophthora megakarya]
MIRNVLQAVVCILLVISPGVLATNTFIQLSKSFGGIHGTKFSDKASVVNAQTLRSISIYTGKRFVTGISLEINKPKPVIFNHGGRAGLKRKLVLGPKEHITSMEVHWGTVLRRTRIVYLGFITNAGNSVAAGFKTKTKSIVKAPKGFHLGGVFGLADKGIVNNLDSDLSEDITCTSVRRNVNLHVRIDRFFDTRVYFSIR